ncbi:MAG: TetR/AcrR family transcriptional regulator [Myxococcota bacterium]
MPRVKTEKKRREILDAAAAVFARKGFHATAVSDIADEVGMGLGTFYRYFENKLAVFHAVIEEVMAEVTAVLAHEQPDSSTTLFEYRAQVRRIGKSLFKAFQENRALARLLFVEAPGISEELNEALQAAVEFFGASTQAYLENGVRRGFLRKDLDCEVTALAINAVIFEGVRHIALSENQKVLDRWLRAVTALMFEGVAAR